MDQKLRRNKNGHVNNQLKSKLKEYEDLNVSEYYLLVQALENAKKQEGTFVRNLSTNSLPYNIPVFYSLEKESKRLIQMANRIKILDKIMHRNDMYAIMSDWEKVGRDIDGAITKSRRVNAK